jgi:hypothetical protein
MHTAFFCLSCGPLISKYLQQIFEQNRLKAAGASTSQHGGVQGDMIDLF